MPATATEPRPANVAIATNRFKPNRFSLSIYGDPATEIDDLLPSIRDHGILSPWSSRPDRAGILGGHLRPPAAWPAPGPWADRSSLRGSSLCPGAHSACGSRIQPPTPQNIQPIDARGRRARGNLGEPRQIATTDQPATKSNRFSTIVEACRSSEFRRSDEKMMSRAWH